MASQKGFSLMEVLISLLLITTLGLNLLYRQEQSKVSLTQFLMQAKASLLLDQIDEALLMDTELPLIPAPYRLVMEKNTQTLQLRLYWFKKRGFLLRSYPQVRIV